MKLGDKEFKGDLSIYRPSSNVRDDKIVIKVEDDSTGILVLKLEIGMAEFAACITGLGNADCTFVVSDCLDLIGKTRESAIAIIPRLNCSKDDEEQIKAATEHLEVDGWIVDRQSIFNHHNFIGKDEVNISLHRYV